MRLLLLVLGSVAAGSVAASTSDDVGPTCDLCARSWIFVLSSGRSGSTSLLEAVNRLPHVHLSGENNAALMPAMELYKRAKAFKKQQGAAFEHGNLSLTSVLCSLQQTFLALDPASDPTDMAAVRGFKELMVPVKNAGGNPRHLAANNTEWLTFLDTLFPCAKIIFNIRANVTEQSGSAFYKKQGVSTAELQRVNQHMLAAHHARGGSRSYLIRLEDFSTGELTKMAHWLGFPDCSYTSIPHANDATAGNKKEYHADYDGVNVECVDTTTAVKPKAATTTVKAMAAATTTTVKGMETTTTEANGKAMEVAPVALTTPQARTGSGKKPSSNAAMSANQSAATSCRLLASPCSPTAAELVQLSSHASGPGVMATAAAPPPTFYLHLEGAFGMFDGMAECFLYEMGIRLDGSLDDVDDHIDANVAEHLSDW